MLNGQRGSQAIKTSKGHIPVKPRTRVSIGERNTHSKRTKAAIEMAYLN